MNYQRLFNKQREHLADTIAANEQMDRVAVRNLIIYANMCILMGFGDQNI
jgi:hypothetical protein